MPDNKQIIIDGMHNILTDDHGLIEVDMGLTKNKNKYNYGIIKSKLINNGITIPLDMNRWSKDSYDDNFKRGILMNVSEDIKYDEMFPNHPLTVLRSFVKYILDNN